MSDVSISKQTKKMLLWVAPENRFWIPLVTGSPTQNKIAVLIRVAHGTIPSWKNGTKISADKAAEVFFNVTTNISENRLLAQSTREKTLKTLEEFIENYGDDTKGVYSTAKIFGMPVHVCQKIIDEVIYNRSPIFSRMYYESASAAQEYFDQYRGVFFVWVKRRGKWLRGVLHVRYPLELAGGFVIRCKFNFPVLDPDHPDKRWEYDGFLTRRPNRIFWMFEKRQRDRNDHFYFITGTGKSFERIEIGSSERERTLSGQYLTAGQDDLQAIVADHILLQRVAYYDPNSPQDTIDLMHESVKVFNDPTECARLNDMLRIFELPSTNGEPMAD